MTNFQRGKAVCADGVWVFLVLVMILLNVTASAQGTVSPESLSKVRISTAEEIKAEFDAVPCNDKDRLNAVKALFEKMGAKPEEITIQKFKNVENVIVCRAAASETTEKIVIGAHYDKTEHGCGAIDNWTGIVTIAHLYRTVKDFAPSKDFVFVAFGKEEKGLVGSSAMVDAIKKEEVGEYCAMLNIDSLGQGVPQVPDNMSNKKLADFAEKLAKETKVPFMRTRIEGADSDSTSFNRRKIPAVTILGLNRNWRNVLHSTDDQVAKINQEYVYLGYRFALALLARVGEADCKAFR